MIDWAQSMKRPSSKSALAFAIGVLAISAGGCGTGVNVHSLSERGNTGPQIPFVRFASSEWFSNWSGSTYKSTNMPAVNTGYSVGTSGVVNGDLLLFIGTIDNGTGANSIWPNPVAPGFTQLSQIYYGNDTETYVVAWKIANNEPATYSGAYGAGLISGSSVITLVAIGGVNPTTPIVASWFGNGGATNSLTPAGVTASLIAPVANCIAVYMGGVDWNVTPGSNTFIAPSGYTILAQLGDRGGGTWDWTSQMVAYKTLFSAGPTGAVTGSYSTGSAPGGVPWMGLVLACP